MIIMKNIIVYTLFFFTCYLSFGQFNISTSSRYDYVWSDNKDDWEFEYHEEEALTFLEFNSDFTLVKHTTSKGTSAYLIKSQEYDNENGKDQYLFSIVSDNGNKYIMIYDIKNQNIRFVTDDLQRMIKFTIKNSWKSE